MSRLARLCLASALAAYALTAVRGTARGWSSTIAALEIKLVRLDTDGFGTHQYLTQRALQFLAEHPAIRAGFIRLPEIVEVLRHGSIDQGQNGLGPDNKHNSLYSWHWYNPELEYDPRFPNGLTPHKVAEYFRGLKNVLALRALNGLPAPAAGPAGDGAHEAAYLAHFIQDMTCAFHMVGMRIPPLESPDPIRLYRDDPLKKRMIAGPFRLFSPEEWDDVVGHAAAAYALDKNSDWFDPSYYDGRGPTENKDGGHFQYELGVELAYMRDGLNRGARWDALLATGLISPAWKRSISPDEFTRLVARATTSKYTVTGADLFPLEARRQGRWPEVPYEDWWRAIQATYTLFRQAFSALIILPDDIKLVKVPGEPDMYQAYAAVRNLEPESDAVNVVVVFEVPGTPAEKGEGGVTRIKLSSASPWIPLTGRIRLPDPDIRGTEIRYAGSSKVLFRVSGEYAVPDAEETVREFPLRDLRIEGIVLPDLKGWTRIEAEEFARHHGLKLKADASAGPAPAPDKAETVWSQKPAPRSVLAAGDEVVLTLYDVFKIAVPDITTPPILVQEAVSRIRTAGLAPPEDIPRVLVDRTAPEGVAIGQDPAPGTLVLPGSPVRFSMAVHAAAGDPAPPPRLDFYASITIVPQDPVISVNDRIRLKAETMFFDTPDGRDRLNVPLDQVHFEWHIDSQQKEDWPAGDVAVMSAAGPEAVLTPVAAGLVMVSCTVANAANQTLATTRVLVVKAPSEPINEAADTTAAAVPPPVVAVPPVVTPPEEVVLPPVSPAEESTELEGVWDTTRGIVIDIRRIGGDDYEGRLVRLYTPEKIKYYKVPIGAVMFRARRTAPGTYLWSMMGGINPKTGEEIWINDYVVIVVKGNTAQNERGIAWFRVAPDGPVR